MLHFEKPFPKFAPMNDMQRGNSTKNLGSTPSPFSFLLLVAMLCCVFSPMVSYVSFHLHFDQHLEECQHLGHHEDCLATCILQETIPGPIEALGDHTLPLYYTFLGLFYQEHTRVSYSPFLAEQGVKHKSYYNPHYCSPGLDYRTPPPQA
ncbi:MAG TPA: hypothetical protein DCE41_24330 [Cytophagales bacterium]|nr:hypothetical protein [Cytophagales bacterium]HAA17777.1 hypothetical protein [Cytophagales bacterium]